jgi:hypothetical protein
MEGYTADVAGNKKPSRKEEKAAIQDATNLDEPRFQIIVNDYVVAVHLVAVPVRDL